MVVCHRDIKASNILLDENFNPIICDFDYTTLIKGKNGKGILKANVGTPSYKAP